MREPNIVHKVLALLSKRERRQVYLLMPAIVVMALLQVVGIASILPFLSLIANPNVIQSNSWLSWLYETFGFSSDTSFLIFLGALALGMLTLSNGVSALTMWALDRFTWRQNYRLARRLLQDYLQRPYSFYLTRNTANLRKNILAEVTQVVSNILVPGMRMIAKLAVTFFILTFLILLDPWLALSAALVLGGAYAAIFTLVRRKLGRIGKERVEAGREVFQIVGEAFGSIKDLKVSGKEESFIRQFSRPSKRQADHIAASHIIGMLPKFALEVVAFGGIILIVLYMLALGQDITQVTPLLGAYAVAIYRLMPALQQVFQSISRIRFSHAALDAIYEEIQHAPGEAPRQTLDRSRIPALPFTRALELRDIHFRYPNTEAPIFEGFNLTIAANTSVAFVGATGSGKTTAADLILGLLRPQGGRLLIDGVELTDETLAGWQKNLGYVPQHIHLVDKSVARNIAFGVPEDRIDMAAVERAAKIASIHEVIIEMPEGYHTKVGEQGLKLSGGQRQRIGIARALYHDPKVLILDEATSALDGITEEAVFEAVDSLAGSKTIIMIAHRMSTIRNCDTIFLLDKGRVVAQGSYDDLQRSSGQFRAMAQMGPGVDAQEPVHVQA